VETHDDFVTKSYKVFTRSSKRPANFQHYICWKFAGRLLDSVNTPLAYQSWLFSHRSRWGQRSPFSGSDWWWSESLL